MDDGGLDFGDSDCDCDCKGCCAHAADGDHHCAAPPPIVWMDDGGGSGSGNSRPIRWKMVAVVLYVVAVTGLLIAALYGGLGSRARRVCWICLATLVGVVAVVAGYYGAVHCAQQCRRRPAPAPAAPAVLAAPVAEANV